MRACACCCASKASPFQAIKTWKTSNDPNYEEKKNHVLELYELADGKAEPGEGTRVVICMDEFGPLNLQPHPGHQWAPAATGTGDQAAPCRCRRRATYKRPHGVRHLLAGYDLSTDRLYGHVKVHKRRTEFLAFMRYLRSLHPIIERIAIVMDNHGPPLSTRVGRPGRGPGRGEQLRTRLGALLRLMAQPDRTPARRPAVLRAERHGASPAAQGHPPSRKHQTGKGFLTRY